MGWMYDDKIGRDLMGSIRMRCTDQAVPSPSVIADKLRQRQISGR